MYPLGSHVTKQPVTKEEDTGPATLRTPITSVFKMHRFSGSSRKSDSLDLGQGLDLSVSKKFPCDSYAAGQH